MFKGRVSALADIGCENSAGLPYDFHMRSEAHFSNFGVAFLSPTSEITSHYFSRKKARVLVICFARSYCRYARYKVFKSAVVSMTVYSRREE